MNYRDQRRHPRITIHRSLSEKVAALQARVTWPNHEISDIVDLSWKGMAVRRPGMFPVNVEVRVRLEVELGGLKPFVADARVAWANLDLIGFEIESLDADGHRAFSAYLGAKLTGASLKPVERLFFGREQTFSFWYQSPDVHVFIWNDPQGRVERVHVRFREETVELERGRRVRIAGGREREAFLLLSQMDKPDHPMEEFLRTLGFGT